MKLRAMLCVVLPPVLVPRYSEYPSHFRSSPAGLYQPVSEPVLPYNASYPHGFRDQQPRSGLTTPASSCSLPGMVSEPLPCIFSSAFRQKTKSAKYDD